MASCACVPGVPPGYEEEYTRRRGALWPEMDACLRSAGVRNYHIFGPGQTLFGNLEPDDLDKTTAILKDDPVNRRWSEHMADIMRIDIDPQTDLPFLIPKQWSLD